MKQFQATITFREGVTREQALDALYSIIRVLDLPDQPLVQEGNGLRGLVAPMPEQLIGHLIQEVEISAKS